MIDLEKLRDLELRATPGPWKVRHEVVGADTTPHDVVAYELGRFRDERRLVARADGSIQGADDADLIVAARNALPGLLERVAAAEAEQDALLESVVCLHAALEEVLAVAERIRGGDASLDPEEWYAARDYARVTLKKTAVLAAPVPPGPAAGGDA